MKGQLATHFQIGEYGPELVALMGAALERAWDGVKDTVRDVDLARLLMAGAIIERVDEGFRDPQDLASAAKRALVSATALFKESDGAPKL